MAKSADERFAWVRDRLRRSKEARPLPGKAMIYFMIYAMFQMMFMQGWNDASQGPLLPLLQQYYQVSLFGKLQHTKADLKVDYVIISLIWISMAVGVIIAALTNVYLADTLGFGYDTQISSLAARMPNATTIMFLTHGMYGLGATVSPFVSTAFIQKVTERFYLYFTISLALAVVSTITLILAFRGRRLDQIVGTRVQKAAPERGGPDAGVPTAEVSFQDDNVKDIEGNPDKAAPPDQHSGDGAVEPNVEEERSSSAKLKAILTSPRCWLMAVYACVYLGVEVSVAGWATTFLIEERGGDFSAGYVSAGFFGGLTLGRFLLIPLTEWLGHRSSVFVYTVLAIALDLIIWLVPSLIGSATCFALIGLVIGPMYPSMMMITTEIMPHDLHTGSIGFIACIGVLGTAMFPFLTGALANRYGVWVLQPLTVALLAASLGIWVAISRFKALDQ